MSTQQPTPQKTHRRPPRKPQHGSQNSRSVVSDNDASNTLMEHSRGSGGSKTRPRGKSHATKKESSQRDAAAYSDGPTQRSTPRPPKPQATPIKNQAYAGPTFHQSPAPSALPLPSFYSKSLPVASPLKQGMDGTQSPGLPHSELNENAVPGLLNEPKREATPLDFLFDAARKANATPGTESPNHRNYLSSAAETPLSRSPAPRENEADFPFELDTGDNIAWDNGSTSSTPYKERIEAARSQRTPSAGGKALDEEERKAKTAALKQFLMTSASSQEIAPDNNPFNARSAPTQPRQYQHRSSPNTPYNAPGQNHSAQYFPPMPQMNHFQSPNRLGPSSNLRNVYQPGPDTTSARNINNESAQQPRISTARDQTPVRSTYADIYKSPSKPRDTNQGHRATPSAQQLEDDLRKFLKLDLTTHG